MPQRKREKKKTGDELKSKDSTNLFLGVEPIMQTEREEHGPAEEFTMSKKSC